MLAGESGKVALLDQCHFGAFARQCGRCNGAVDPAANHQHIVASLSQLLDITGSQLHGFGGAVRSCKTMRETKATATRLASTAT